MIKEHRKLKLRAVRWLQDRGYTIATEISFGTDRVDVVGQKEESTIGIECGNTSYKKLMRLQKMLDCLYIWLYVENSPIVFSSEPVKYRNVPKQNKAPKMRRPTLQELHRQYDLYFPR